MKAKFRAWDRRNEVLTYSIPINYKGCSFNDLNDLLASDRYVFMLSTGLEDVDGNEIYEGDVINYKHNNTTIVKFIDGCFCVRYKRSENVMVTTALSYFMSKYKIRVIGNIYSGRRRVDNFGRLP